jgi:hypothetical protein
MEKFESPESIPPTREAVVDALKNRNLEDPEVKALINAYAEAREKEANEHGGQYAPQEVVIHMCQIYFDSEKYRDYAIESLIEMMKALSGPQGALVDGKLVTVDDGTMVHEEMIERIGALLNQMLRDTK